MNLRALPKPQLVVADIAFGIALAVLYVGFSLALKNIQSEVNALFLASYALLGLGALVFYLVFAANSKLALLLHVWIFPLFSTLNLFLRWMPSVIGSIINGSLIDVQALSSLILVYVLFLFTFFIIQSILRTRILKQPVG